MDSLIISDPFLELLKSFAFGLIGGFIVSIPVSYLILAKWLKHRRNRTQARNWRRYS